LTANIDANITLTAQGTISGTGSLTKTGAGTLAVTAPDSSWGGTTLISAGTLQIGSGAADGSIPDLPITDNGSLFFNSANSFTLTNEISGTGSLTKRQDGMLTLSASNSFTGNITTGVGTAPQQSGGVLRILNNYALGSTPKTVTLVRAELQLEGSLTISTGITFRTSTADLTFAGAGLAAMRNVSGNNVIQGAIILTSGGGSSEYRVDAGQLSLNGVITPDTTARTLILSGTSPGFLNGPLNNSTNAFVPALEKRDAGIWTLSASNTYSGSTTIKGGTLTLAATGSISNSPVVDVQSGATLNVAAVSGGFVLGTNQTLMGSGSVVGNVLAAGSMSPGASVGTLTFANNLVLAGTTVMELDRLAVTNADLIIASVLTYGGSLIVTNIGDPLQSGDTFNLFDWTTRSGSFTTVQLPALDPGLGWTNKLSVDGTLQVITTVSTTPTNLTFQVTGNTLEISWPSDHIGWRLEAQTNALNIGLNNNWAEVPNTTTTNKVFLPINPANGTVFFRLAF
jgi:autotransporter-associated beta strand protein